MYYTLFFGFYFIIQFFCEIEGRSFHVSIDELGVGATKNYVVNESVIYVIEIKNLSNVIERVPPRIYVKCEGCNENHPLLVVVNQNKGILSWELPLVFKSNNYLAVYKNIERTLCPYDIINMTALFSETNVDNQNVIHPVTLALSTSSSVNKHVELLVNLEEEFELHLDENKTVVLSPSTPVFYLFEFLPENNVTSVLLEIQSEDDICLIVSVQNVSCPVFDLEENIAYRGHFQTATRQGGLTLTKEAFPNGFYVVLVVSGEDNYCSTELLYTAADRNKTINIKVSKSISIDDYKLPIYSTIGVITLFCTVMFIIFFCSIRREMKKEPCLDNDCMTSEEFVASASGSSPLILKNETTSNTAAVVTPSSPNADSVSVKTDSSLDETDYDFINDAEFDKNIYRMKNYLYVCDLARKKQCVLEKKSDLYFRSLITVATFYFLPVIQLVFADQYRFNQSGREDLCYYNFLCSHPLWWFSDFNHIFSNIGYVIFGGLFIFSTAMKERMYKAKISSNKKLSRFYGIPQHFGLFYAMGAALIVEGIMSSCYHVCPNHYNFQFDTSFMYVICTLCMIKIYQTRHPDISANAYATFSLLSVVIFLGMYGVFSSSLTFWILFTVVHLSTCTYLSLQIYYMGRWKWSFIGLNGVLKKLQLCCNWKCFSPMFPSRFALLFLANVCNWGLAIASFVYKIDNFSSYLLTIFMANLLLYTSFYILMKFICSEKLLLQSKIYILLSMLCWGTALYFFLSKTVSWRLSPAESKLYNQKCNLLNFYDNHDIWHFISAAAMFFSFMVLLTLDDDLVYVHRSKIVVF